MDQTTLIHSSFRVFYHSVVVIRILITLCATLRLRGSIYSSIILHEAKLQCTICFLTESCM